LEGTLRYALERELGRSPFVNVVPRERVQDVLRLMRKPEDSPMTAGLAREISLRDGNIQALVTGAVDRLGTGYLVGANLADSQTGTALRSRTEQVGSQSELFGAIKRLSTWIRAALGERGATGRHDALPRVTTSSLSALRYFGKAQEAWASNQVRAARVLLEAAVREDPEFASAHSLLAHALSIDPDARTLAPASARHNERALALSTHTPEEERLRIVATYHSLRREHVEAATAGEALVRLRPDDWDAHLNLGIAYAVVRRTREAVVTTTRAAELRPNDFRVAVRAAQAWAWWAGEPERARPYVDRARQLWPSQVAGFSAEPIGTNLPALYTRDVAWLLFFPAYERWRGGDVEGMLGEVQHVLETEPLAKSNERDAFLTIAIAMNMTVGRQRHATALASRMFQDGVRELHLAVAAEAVDDVESMRTHMSRIPFGAELRPLRYVRAGLYREADDILARPDVRSPNASVARGELTLRRGRRAEGIELLRGAIEMTRADTLSERYLAAESLATELVRLGEQDEALKVLEEAASDLPRFARTVPAARTGCACSPGSATSTAASVVSPRPRPSRCGFASCWPSPTSTIPSSRGSLGHRFRPGVGETRGRLRRPACRQ
jgi:tetratricopeptide (TPR) repeat protein